MVQRAARYRYGLDSAARYDGSISRATGGTLMWGSQREDTGHAACRALGTAALGWLQRLLLDITYSLLKKPTPLAPPQL